MIPSKLVVQPTECSTSTVMQILTRGNNEGTDFEERKMAMKDERADSLSGDENADGRLREERRLRDREDHDREGAPTTRKSRRSHSRSRGSDGKDRSRRKRRKKHESSSDSDSSISQSSRSASSDGSSSSEEESSDGERHKRERRRREHKRRSSRRSDKDSKEKKSRKRRKQRRSSSHKDRGEGEEEDGEAEKKRRLVKEAKKLLKKHNRREESNSREIVASGRKVEKISADEYFLKSSEFATWLKEDRGVYFSDLSSKETHQLFEAFVDKWNAGRLHAKFYDGIQQAPRTNHNWAIKRGPEDVVDKDEEYALAKQREKRERKKFQKEYEANLDDILPKAAAGRERQMEQKAIRREQARAREESPPELMKERDIMGGGDDFQLRLAREKARRVKKQAEKMAAYSEKSSVFQEKESATMEQFKTLVNVAGGKITIAKRQ